MSKKLPVTIAKARDILGTFHRRLSDTPTQRMIDLFTFFARSVLEKGILSPRKA